MNKLRYFWKGDFYYIDLYKDNLEIKFSEYEKRNKTSEFQHFTGLNDKNNKEIYDGDIIESQVDSGIDLSSGLKIPKPIAVVVFINGCFDRSIKNDFYENNIRYDLFDNIEYQKVIGNIYKNPELLKTSSNTDYKKKGG